MWLLLQQWLSVLQWKEMKLKLLWPPGGSPNVYTLILSAVQSKLSILLFVVAFVYMPSHTYTRRQIRRRPHPFFIFSTILWVVTGSCAKITNSMLPYSSPLLLTLISFLPSFPSIVQDGTSGLLNLFSHSPLSNLLEAWMTLNIEHSFYRRSLMDWGETFLTGDI